MVYSVPQQCDAVLLMSYLSPVYFKGETAALGRTVDVPKRRSNDPVVGRPVRPQKQRSRHHRTVAEKLPGVVVSGSWSICQSQIAARVWVKQEVMAES